jgi:hypothetical protein
MTASHLKLGGSITSYRYRNIIYEGRLQSSWTHLITPSRNFVEVHWRSRFRSTSPWQEMHFLQRSTNFSKTCCRPLITSKFLASELSFQSHGARFGFEKVGQWTPLEHSPHSPVLSPCDFWAFPTMKRELRRKKFRISDQRSATFFREMGGAL